MLSGFFIGLDGMQERTDSRWFRKVSGEFCPILESLAGKPIHYVEIGCWEGASALWVAENVLTHPDSQGWGIDPYSAMLPRHSQQDMDERCDRAARMLEGHRNWQWIREPSAQALKRWEAPIDCLYIDGVHEGPHSLIDFVLAWPHLTVGAVVIFDDYAIGMRKGFPCVPECVRAVESAFSGLVELIGAPRRQAAFRVVRKDTDAVWFRQARVVREPAVA